MLRIYGYWRMVEICSLVLADKLERMKIVSAMTDLSFVLRLLRQRFKI